MQRRQTNSTRYDSRSRKLFWRLEWRFAAATAAVATAATAAAAEPQQQQQQQAQQQAAAAVTVFDGRVDEEVLLSTVLGRHLEYRQGAGEQALQLQAYRQAGVDSLTVLMRKERCQVG
jgi:anti-sigma-K factor RskA